MSLLCRLFDHDWSDWNSPVYVFERDGLDIDAVQGSQRKCTRCGVWDTKPEAGQ